MEMWLGVIWDAAIVAETSKLDKHNWTRVLTRPPSV